MKKNTDIRDIDVKKTWCLERSLNFARYSFKSSTGQKFIVSNHHVVICDALDKVFRGEITRLMINLPPRYSKTQLFVKTFIPMGLGINPRARFIHLSYSDDLVRDNSRDVQNTLRSPEYQALFDAMPLSTNTRKWYTKEGGGLYAVSSSGQVTGFGAGLVEPEDTNDVEDEEKDLDEFTTLIEDSEGFGGAIVIDDPIKPDDALSDTIREKVNQKFETTIRNRVNSRKTPIIIIMQRLHEHDLCGYLKEIEPDDWTVISLPAIEIDAEGNEVALWPHKHTLEELRKIEKANSFVFETQYMQNPTPIEGLMYREFRTYEVIPYSQRVRKKNYTDTADTGNDYLCSICYDELPEGNFITDILYTKKPMEYTEPKTAEMLAKNKTQETVIESNNGGRGFARNVERLSREMGNTRTSFVWFAQTDNKQVRIFSHSADVNNMTFFPAGWERRWPEFARDIKSYRKEGGNANDDAPDTLTGTFERRTVMIDQNITKEDLGLF